MRFIVFLVILAFTCFAASCGREDGQPSPEPSPIAVEVDGHIMLSLVERSGKYYLKTDTVESIGDPIELPVPPAILVSTVYTGDVVKISQNE